MIGLGLGLGIGARVAGAASSWLPSDEPTLRGWFKGDVGYVAGTSWADQSGLGHNLSAGGGGTIAGPTLNGRGTVGFRAASVDFMSSGAFSLGAAGAVTIAAVFKVTDVSATRAIASYNDGAFDVTVLDTDTSGHSEARDFIAGTPGTSVLTNTWARGILTAAHPGSLVLYVNGTQEATATENSAIADGKPFYAGRDTSIGTFMNGYMAELLIFASALSPTTAAKLDTYLKTAWAL